MAKKTNAKKIGIKTVFASSEGRYTVATFGRGAAADIAFVKNRDADVALPARSTSKTPVQFTRFVDFGLEAERGEFETIINNPVDNYHEDYLGLKGALEELVFGRRFPGDTIRIQLANCIFDVQKILGMFVADALHFVNNLLETEDDAFGRSLNDERMEVLLKKAAPYLGFFGGTDLFALAQKGSRRNNKKMQDEHNAKVFRALGALRQTTAHFRNSLALFGKDAELPMRMFDPRGRDAGVWTEIIAPLWRARIERLQDSFVQTSLVNLTVLYEIFGDKTEPARRSRAQEYYRFTVLKEGKNLGFSLTKVREAILKQFHPSVVDEKDVRTKRIWDSIRSKIYALLDFILFLTATSEPAAGVVSDALAQLREAPAESGLRKKGPRPDSVRDKIYKDLGMKLYLLCRPRATALFDRFSDKSGARPVPAYPDDLKNLANDGTIVHRSWIENLGGEDAAFNIVQILSFLCNFLEGKEINELLTACVRKFQGIQSFIDLIRESGEKVVFTRDFALFNENSCEAAGIIADQLRLLAGFGKMKSEMDSVKKVLYQDALAMLGASDRQMSDEWLEENVLLGNEARRDRAKRAATNPFRNFIAKNVITSRRFYYLVRYAKPAAVRALMGNPKIVRYVLQRLPESQVESNYRTVFGDNASANDQIVRLTEKLTNFSFDMLVDAKGEIVANTKQGGSKVNVEIEKLKALTGLYMAVAYIAVKNLVKTNARYYIAYAAYERDLHLFTRELAKEGRSLNEFMIRLPAKPGAIQPEVFDLLALTRLMLAHDREAIEENRAIRAELSKICSEFYALTNPSPETVAAHRARQKELNKRRKETEKRAHFSKKWYDIFVKHDSEVMDLQETGFLVRQARNDTMHLSPLVHLEKYIGDFRKGTPYSATSYFEIYHYLRQRRLLEDLVDRGVQKGIINDRQRQLLGAFLDVIREKGAMVKDLQKCEYLCFGYCLPRYKNLTVEALFDIDSVSGQKKLQKFEEKEREKEARRKGK